MGQTVAFVQSARGDGSGFVIGKGLLVTNEHVVRGADKVGIILAIARRSARTSQSPTLGEASCWFVLPVVL